MTAQIPDTFIYQSEEYDLIGMSGGDLAYPQQFGMEPVMIHTACYKGFYATYELTEDSLVLRELTLREKNANYLTIQGVEPSIENNQATYHELNVRVGFTGKLRLAKDFIDELYIHMGFQKPTAFKTVLDFTLDQGQVTNINDRSREVEQKRGAFKDYYDSDSADLSKRIHDAFSLDMDIE